MTNDSSQNSGNRAREPHNGSASSDIWDAWRYVAGEMDEGERDAFEQRLDGEQPLREAVAEAWELHETIGVAAGARPETPAPVVPVTPTAATAPAASAAPVVESAARNSKVAAGRWARGLAWLATGVAAGWIAFAVLTDVPRPRWSFLGSSGVKPTDREGRFSADATDWSRLGVAWSETRTHWTLETLESSETLAGESLEAPESQVDGVIVPDEPLGDAEDQFADVAAPDWMITALELARYDADDEPAAESQPPTEEGI